MKQPGEFGKRIRKLREELGITQTELASRAGYTSRSSINKIELGDSDVPHSRIHSLAVALGVSDAYLLGVDIQTSELPDGFLRVEKKRLPFLGEASGGAALDTVTREIFVEEGAAGEIDYCLRVTDESMSGAKISTGDTVFIKKTERAESGDIVAALYKHEILLRRIYYKDKNKLILQAESPEYEPVMLVGGEAGDLKIIGTVIAVQCRIR